MLGASSLFGGNFKRFFYTHAGQVIISVLLGLGIATLFRKVCNDKNCIEFRGPPISAVENKIFHYDDRCYTYQSRATSCRDDRKTVKLQPEIAAAIATGGAINPAASMFPAAAAATTVGGGSGAPYMPVSLDASGGGSTGTGTGGTSQPPQQQSTMSEQLATSVSNSAVKRLKDLGSSFGW